MILDNVAHLLPGLLPASFRGVSFDMPDTSTEVGRRVCEHLFPGIDRAAYDDMGRLPDRISVEGVILGDDYIAQAARLSAAFTRAGPGTLMHPWLGGMTVIMLDAAEISFSARELRMARFNAVFKKVGTGGAVSVISTVAQLLTTAAAFGQTALALLASPGRLTVSQARGRATVRSSRIISAAWSTLAPVQRFDVAALAVSPPVSFSGSAATSLVAAMAAAAPGTPEALATRVASFSSALVGSVPAASSASAIAPAAESVAAAAGLSPLAGASAGLFVAGQIQAAITDAPSPTDMVMLLGSVGSVLATVAGLTGRIEFGSRDEAATYRATIADAVDRFSEMASSLSMTDFASPASLARRAASALRAAVIADINEAIGRLPAVMSIETSRPADAFQVANHIYGDELAVLEAGYLSIVGRNRHRHPAALPAGRIEALR